MDMEKNNSISRRKFLQGVGVGATGLGVASLGITGLSGCAAENESTPTSTGGSFTFADTIKWDAEYDVVVIGFGGAGGVSAIYAADAGAKVLLCDIAPEGEEGGNTRFAAQMCVSGSDPDQTLEYYKNLAWHFEYDEEMLRTYAEGLCQVPEHLAYLGSTDPFTWPSGVVVCPEYPEYAGGQQIVQWYYKEGMYNSALWQAIHDNVVERSDSIDVWLESPGTSLIQDPQSKTILGAKINRKGEELTIRAKNGVVLSCGGFENNTRMIQDFLGCARFSPIGTLHNNGDGVRMGMEVGADLWHMDAYESLGTLSGNAWAVPDGERAKLEKGYDGISPLISLTSEHYGTGSVFLVGDDGGRFIDEFALHRHGHVYSNGVWRMPTANYAPHLIFDQAQYDLFDSLGVLEDGRKEKLISASTPEELAELIGADPAIFKETVDDFNAFAAGGRDIKFGRDPESMRALDGTIYYAAEFRAAILNTQGGPRRNKNAEVVDTQGNPIPHLYSAGELGGICAFQYNSGGNLSECLVFGKIAGTNAAAEKEALPFFEIPQVVEPTLSIQPGDENDALSGGSDVSLAAGEYIGVGKGGMGGDIEVKVSYEDSTIKAIEVISEHETPDIGGVALEDLKASVLEKNSTEVDTISGATMTSTAFLSAVEDAIAQA